MYRAAPGTVSLYVTLLRKGFFAGNGRPGALRREVGQLVPQRFLFLKSSQSQGQALHGAALHRAWNLKDVEHTLWDLRARAARATFL